MAKKTRQLFKQGRSNNWTTQIAYCDSDGKKITYKKSLGTSDNQNLMTLKKA